MKGMNKVLKGVLKFAKKNAPEILTGLGIAGLVTTTVLAVKSTPKAMEAIDEAKKELNKDALTAKETIRSAWKYYIPSATTGVLSIACIVLASTTNHKRNTALAAAYALSEASFQDYSERVIKEIGAEKEAEIRHAVVKDKIESFEDEDIITARPNGDELFFEPCTGRLFWSTKDSLSDAKSAINDKLYGERYVVLDDWSYELGLGSTKVTGEILGWIPDNGPIGYTLKPAKTKTGKLCWAICYTNPPRYIR